MAGWKVDLGRFCDREGEAPAEPQPQEDLAPAHAARQGARTDFRPQIQNPDWKRVSIADSILTPNPANRNRFACVEEQNSDCPRGFAEISFARDSADDQFDLSGFF